MKGSLLGSQNLKLMRLLERMIERRMRKLSSEKIHDAAYKEDEAGLREMMRLPTPERNSLRIGMRMKKQDPRTKKLLR
jgi:hypothetical protein